MKSVTIILTALLLAGCDQSAKLPPGDFAAKAVLSTGTLQVGDPVTLTLTARHAPGSTVRFPAIGKGKEVAVRGRSVDTSERAEGVLKTEEIYQLTSFRIGDWIIITNPVVCTFADGTQKAQELPPLTLQVVSTLTEKNANSLSDIKGPIRKLPVILWVMFLIIGIALIAGLIVLLLVKRPKAVIGSEPVIPPHIRAREALNALRKIEWLPEPFFVDLSLILRTYLEDRFALNAPESTTEELAEKLKQDARLNQENRQTLQRFFKQSDLVKFAQAGAEQEVMQTAFDTVTQFVFQTMEEQSE